MSVEQFPDTFYVKILNTGVTERIGSISLQDHAVELSYLNLSMLRVGAVVSEQARLHVYLDSALAGGIFASSDWRELSEFTPTAGNAYGRLRFDFDRLPLKASTTYYLGIETANYTRIALTNYLAVKLDWPDDIYDAGSATSRGAQLRIIGYR